MDWHKFCDALSAQEVSDLLWELKRKHEDNLRQDPNLNEAEKQLVQEGKMIPAIKAYRSRTGFGLKESHNLCLSYRETLGK